MQRMATILARPASPFSFFGDLIAQPPLTALARVEAAIGRKMIQAEVEKCQITALQYLANHDDWQGRLLALAVFALIGFATGLVMFAHTR
jgi:hypothetical protein